MNMNMNDADSPSLGPLSVAIHNISSRHLHEINLNVPDDRQFLKSWRRTLQECLTQQNARLLQFLVADVSGSGTGTGSDDVTRRCTDVLTKYSKPTWNFASSTRELVLPTSIADEAAWIESELGIHPSVLREHIRKAIRLYTNTASSLSAAESGLQEKLNRLEVIVSRINDLMFMEPTQSLGELAEPTKHYLDSVLDKIDISDNYLDVVTQYKRFALLKGIVSLAGFQKSATPMCTICMVKEVSHAVTPCGHTFCDECCQKQLTSCYICRVQIRDRMRLYFG